MDYEPNNSFLALEFFEKVIQSATQTRNKQNKNYRDISGRRDGWLAMIFSASRIIRDAFLSIIIHLSYRDKYAKPVKRKKGARQMPSR